MRGSSLRLLIILTLGLTLCLPGVSGAWFQEFANDYPEANAIYLWIDPGTNKVEFTGTTFAGGHADWRLTLDQPFQQIMTGPAKPKYTGGIRVGFTDPPSQSFSLQWAEVLWSGNAYNILGSGSLGWTGSGWSSSNVFSHSRDIAAPLPASVLLLGSGLVGIGLLGRRRKECKRGDQTI